MGPAAGLGKPWQFLPGGDSRPVLPEELLLCGANAVVQALSGIGVRVRHPPLSYDRTLIDAGIDLVQCSPGGRSFPERPEDRVVSTTPRQIAGVQIIHVPVTREERQWEDIRVMNR
jgi:hypothetical protein